MAVDSNFFSLFQNIKLDDPWLPSQPWECISSESGVSHSKNSNSKPSLQESLHGPSTISEVNLVRLAINALQGVEASLHSIEKLSASFSTIPADRSSHGIPSLWHRSSSTNALGKILETIGRSGSITFLVRKFVDYSRQNLNVGESSRDEFERRSDHGGETNTHHAGSLVNQAFAVAVEKVLEGFICALDTLYASVQLRRSPKDFDICVNNSSGVGCLTSVVHSEITFMEVYLHTKELRTQIEAIGNICLFKNVALAFSTLSIKDLAAEATVGFLTFPRGADLLSYLYAQLRDADPVHHALLKFIFIRSCEPYYGFIKSWIYEAKINDPYKEFIVECMNGPPSHSHSGASFPDALWLSSIRVREGVSVPCFLENFCLPLLRAGQQLQVLITLLELCNFVCAEDQTYEDILPCWSGSSSFCWSTMPPLTFSKVKMEEMVLMRENMYIVMQEKLQILFARLDNRYQPISSNVIPYGVVPFVSNNSRDTSKVQALCSMDESMINPPSAKGDSNLEAGTHNSETSSATGDLSYLVDPFESSSECSSCNSSGEEVGTVEAIDPNDSSIEAELRCLSASGYFNNLSNENRLPNLSQMEMPSSRESTSCTTVEIMNPIRKSADPQKEEKSSHISEHKLPNANWFEFSDTVYADYESVNCWPLGGLSKNPFCDDRGRKLESQSHLTLCSLKTPDKNEHVFVGKVPYSGELFTCDDSLPQQVGGDIQLATGTHPLSNSRISTSWKLKYNCNVFNVNPMLTKNAWCCMIDKPRSRSCLDHKQSFLSYFNFSSVEDPRMGYGEKLSAGPDHGFQTELDSCIKAVDKCFGEQKHGEPDIPVAHRSSFYDTPIENRQKEDDFTSISGGAKWEISLSYRGKRPIHSSGDHNQRSGTSFDVPLDIIIEKCILQEILLQYEYISNFTIKLLEEGFDLQGHLLALRRYHFMEFADWADLFIMLLWRHKWSVAEASEKISEIQGFLDTAVQRSSCEGDPYKERLYLYMKGPSVAPLATPANGVHAFDFIALGYRVDWPISIVLTSSALKIYADIFSFLIQVKLAAFSLTDVWCTIKDLDHLISQNRSYELDERDKTYLKFLMRMRHQVSHFVSTLQQYVQSELSHISWCRFLHSLKHQVRDMFDLESVHMAYLADSLHICFLSDETQQIACIIESILQCALDFRSCFTVGCWEIGSGCRDSSKFLGRLDISQVVGIKARFDKNVKELYVYYLKSPKHGEFSLSRFGGYLNYNDYYSDK